jgi:phosphatidylserine/phosphatidylglycerophosphate/cardiolipin synthase-like enzyme
LIAGETNGSFSAKAYVGDAKTLLTFNFAAKKDARGLAGFTVQITPKGQPSYYLDNTLQFEKPGAHAQDPTKPATSSINAPIHKFRWVHFPGSVHQGTTPAYGPYDYRITPRFFDDKQSLQPLDPARGVTLSNVPVGPFRKGSLALGFTRGYTQSQAFVHHFGLRALIKPNKAGLLFDTSAESGTSAAGQKYTYADEYEWLGFTARQQVFAVLNRVLGNKALTLRMFAYDLNEPDIIEILLKLAAQGRVRIILDSAALHHSKTKPKPEDQFEKLFRKAKKGKSAILRGKFSRYAHDKVFIVSNKQVARTVLTGSTNFSVTGLYVNSNHVLVFDDAKVAAKYAEVFEAVWTDKVSGPKFKKSPLSATPFSISSKTVPATDITFAPHTDTVATQGLDAIVKRVKMEGQAKAGTGSVLFAVMQMDKGTSAVYTALNTLHKNESIFSYGISDSPAGVKLYSPKRKTGVLVTGKPFRTRLPKPFDQVPGVGLGHQIHHKFIVCGFNGNNPVVYCGSSNLAGGGEKSNGDNLLAIHDGDVATAFAIEALSLVDHFNFLDRYASVSGNKKPKAVVSEKAAAAAAGWYLGTTDNWTEPYFDPNDLRSEDRELFA